MDSLTDSAVQTRDSLPIPVDLVINIFSRLPAKSVARYRCLSKFWYDLIRSQYFIDLFAVNSSAQPQILFANKDRTGISFFSAHQPSENSSFDTISPTHLSRYPKSTNCCYYGVPVNGLVCLEQLCGIWRSSIYNPSSGEILTLPIVKTTYPYTKNLLGYDPTEKQFKVLSLNYGQIQKEDGRYERDQMEFPVLKSLIMEIQVLTIETEELSWRMVECFKSHRPLPLHGEICINGVLYYRAICASSDVEVIVCFHVRSETFRFINVKETFNKEQLPRKTILTNYDGKLSLLMSEGSNSSYITGESTSFELWVLSDAEKHEWSKHVYLLPPDWKDVVGKNSLRFVGKMGTTEIVLSAYGPCPYIFFSYNIKKNIVRRLNIQGMEASTLEQSDMFLNYEQSDMFLNYVEDVSLYKIIK